MNVMVDEVVIVEVVSICEILVKNVKMKFQKRIQSKSSVSSILLSLKSWATNLRPNYNGIPSLVLHNLKSFKGPN